MSVLISRSVALSRPFSSPRLKTCRCDCSFVLAVPVQTSVGKVQSVVAVRESGSASALPSRRRLFRTISCGDSLPHWPVVFSARQHSPCDPRELVCHRNHNNIFRSSCIQCVEPGPNWGAVALDAQHGSSCAVNQNLTQIYVAALADAEQFRFTSGRVLSWYDAQPRCEVEGGPVANGSNDGSADKLVRSLGSDVSACIQHPRPRSVPVPGRAF